VKDRAIIFTTDCGYIVPTLLVVRQILDQPKPMAMADVIVFLVGVDSSVVTYLRGAFHDADVSFIEMDAALIEIPEDNHFKSSPIPTTTLARLFTPTLIPEQYRQILYLDGDIQILGDLYPLVAYEVPSERILAANDQLFMSEAWIGHAGRYWRRHLTYLKALGVSASRYFNAGILAARVDFWSEICRDALRYFSENAHLCLYHDQSALNAVCADRRVPLSLNYNYQTPFYDLQIASAKPRILHFSGAAKPWNAAGESTKFGSFRQPYLDLIASHPELSTFYPKPGAGPLHSPRTLLSPLADVYADRLNAAKRRRFWRYMKTAPFPFQ
jgi:lipopolysaccharide biosynthesis glycosyltransferase